MGESHPICGSTPRLTTPRLTTPRLTTLRLTTLRLTTLRLTTLRLTTLRLTTLRLTTIPAPSGCDRFGSKDKCSAAERRLFDHLSAPDCLD
jgi:hypothetical protein